MRRAVSIVLTDDERSELTTLARSRAAAQPRRGGFRGRRSS